MTSNELTLHPDQTFRRVWSALMVFYVAAVLLLQFKGEALRPKEVAPPAADEPPRIARILPSPVDVPPPAPIAVPPAVSVKELPPPPLPVEVKKEAPKPEVKKEAKTEMNPEVKRGSPAPPLPIAPSKPAIAEKLAKAERPSSAQPTGKTETLPAAPAFPSGPPPTESAAPRPAPKEEVKKVGLLGLLGGGKGKASDPSLSQTFSLLKEIPSPSPLPSAAPSPSALSPREKKGPPPAASISPETLEQIRKQTVDAQEKGLVRTRRAAIEENLSEMRTSEGGELNQSAISGIANQNKERLLQLYRRRLQQNPNVKGSVTVEFVISPEGKVLKCHLLSTSLSDPLFENEIVKEILQWRFPAGEKGATTVLYPLSFSPAG